MSEIKEGVAGETSPAINTQEGASGETSHETRIKGEFICVVCPNGCAIDAEFERGAGQKKPRLLSFEGNGCERGEEWIKQEVERPMRTVATSVLVTGGDALLASVRTSRPIPLGSVRAVIDAIRGIKPLAAPVRIGDVLLKNPAGTETDIIVTRNVAAG